MRYQGLLYLGGLTVLAFLSGWMLLTVEASLSDANPLALNAPSLYMDQVEATRMNALGQKEYTLRADHLRQLPGDGGTHLEQPVLELYREGRELLWRVEAERGWVSPDQSLIRLEENVVLDRTAAGGPPLTITTSLLLARPQESFAHTDAPARLVTPAGVVDAVGVRAYLDQQRLELLSRVRGYYEPPPR